MNWIFFLSLLILFEIIADILAKEWSLKTGLVWAVGAILAYVIANTFWLFALKNGSGLARGAVIFSVVSAVFASLIGIILYKEYLTKIQLVGIFLGIISVALIFWNE
ncbi:MAG TPA: SMR family transporter [bacterium]|nr:SMR family transporter [bacterium]HPL95516.1 SMR family transporter [bacterium]